MKINKFTGLTILLVLGLFLIPGVLATTTLNTPATGGNYTTLTVDCSTNVNASANSYNVSIWYNATGGYAGQTKLVTITNTSAAQNSFTGAVNIESLSDLRTYNFSCYADNGTDQEWSVSSSTVTIDNTEPSINLMVQLSGDYASYGSVLDYTCGLSDATDTTLATQSFTVAHPTGDDTSSTTLERNTGANRQFADTNYPGTYVFTCTATDSAGNVGTQEETVTVNKLGKAIVNESSGFNLNNNTIIIVVVLLILSYLIFKK